MYCPTEDRAGTEAALSALLDLLFEERGYQPIASAQNDQNAVRSEWFEHLMPSTKRPEIEDLLMTRRYVIIQGPPGTGKTMIATELLRDEYGGRGRSVQFHANQPMKTSLVA